MQPNTSEEQALNYALWQGWVTEYQADRLCIHLLGMPPAEVSGQCGWDLVG